MLKSWKGGTRSARAGLTQANAGEAGAPFIAIAADAQTPNAGEGGRIDDLAIG
jgi:hypothetical protein